MAYPWSTGEVLTAADLNAGIDNHPRCSLYQTTNITVGNAAITQLTWNSEYFDSQSMHSTTTNTGRITIPTGWGGLYLLNASIEYSKAGTTPTVIAYIRKNGGGADTFGRAQHNSVVDGITLNVTAMIDLAAGDWVELAVYQNSGGNATFLGTNSTVNKYPNFSAIWLGKNP